LGEADGGEGLEDFGAVGVDHDGFCDEGFAALFGVCFPSVVEDISELHFLSLFKHETYDKSVM
jgi:hypothetical protein